MNPTQFIRSYSTRKSIQKSASAIRREFLEYFQKDLGHSFIRSSSVNPIHDPSVAFVNAGMNQFKGVFLNYYEPPETKVVNSQKCIRVGGKHNDLSIVGSDTYHHTFFEMLGNWSFGDYFKEEACIYAWDLLTKHYGIDKNFLYVTYFGGDKKLGLEPDLECRDIWLRIGVPEDKILPFGPKENFWEVGPSGPCGPCTEIHIDHTKQSKNRSSHVNKDYADLTELWNIVFIQYQRLDNGTIIPLPKHHVDTGMGFERLVALLQGKKSNYDTDLFQPYFKAIQKYANTPEYKGKFGAEDKNRLDSAYRILADHSRMIAVALSDGMFPEKNPKLRRVIRKAINISEDVFNKPGLVPELTSIVAENLGDFYPELQSNYAQMQKVVQFEEELFKILRNTSGKKWRKLVRARPELSMVTDWTAAGLEPAYKYLQTNIENLRKEKVLPGSVVFKLHDTYGLNEDTIAELAKIESLHFDESLFEKELNNHKLKSRMKFGTLKITPTEYLTTFESNSMLKTDDSFKYQYSFDGNCYQFPTIKSKIIGIIINDKVMLHTEEKDVQEQLDVSKLTASNEIGIILDKTVFFSAEGGQESDKGFISVKNMVINVDRAKKVNDTVVHIGKFVKDNSTQTLNSQLKVGDDCEVSINPTTRVGAMMHHTGAHLLNASLKRFIPAIYPRKSVVNSTDLKYHFNSFNDKLSLDQMRTIEAVINNVIKADTPVTTKVVNSLELSAEDSLTLVPGEIYPHTGLRIVNIDSQDLKSKEPCCGTHTHTTGVLKHFCILSYEAKGSNLEIVGVFGPLAESAQLTGKKVEDMILDIENKLNTGKCTFETMQSLIKQVNLILNNASSKNPVPYLVRTECLSRLTEIDKHMEILAKETEMSSVKMEVKNAMDAEYPFIVCCLQKNLEHLSLKEIVFHYSETPVLIVSKDGKIVKAMCRVPEDMVSEDFNAQKWMKIVLENFEAEYSATKKSSPLLLAKMKPIEIPEGKFLSLAEKAMTEATEFARAHIRKLNVGEKVN